MYEAIGYVGSALIILSLTQKSILRLRVIGLAGSLTFLVYSLLIEAYPIAVVNVLAASIHLWFLRKLVRRKAEVFRVLHVDADSKYLLDFLDHYRDDIVGRFKPDFRYEPLPDQTVAFILRDMVPAGLLIGLPHEDCTVEVKLDYVIPQYRDFKIGSYVYSDASGIFTDRTCRRAWATATNSDYAAYLRRMGFRADGTAADRYVIDLDWLSAPA